MKRLVPWLLAIIVVATFVWIVLFDPMIPAGYWEWMR